MFGSKAKKHKADTVGFDNVSLCASDEEDDTPSLTAEVAALLPPDEDTGNKGPEADETHILLDELAIRDDISHLLNTCFLDSVVPPKPLTSFL